MFYLYHICVLYIVPVFTEDSGRMTRAGFWKYLQKIFQKSSSCCVRCLTWRIMVEMGQALFKLKLVTVMKDATWSKGHVLWYFCALEKKTISELAKFSKTIGSLQETKTSCKYSTINLFCKNSWCLGWARQACSSHCNLDSWIGNAI